MNARQAAKHWKKIAQRPIKPKVIFERCDVKRFGYSQVIAWEDWERIKSADPEIWDMMINEIAAKFGEGLIKCADWNAYRTTENTLLLELHIGVTSTEKPGLFDVATVDGEVQNNLRKEGVRW